MSEKVSSGVVTEKIVTKPEGPAVAVRIDARCDGCCYSESTYYCIEDGNDVDSGFTYKCTLPVLPGCPPFRPKDGGVPPECCPFLKGAVDEAFAAALRRRIT